LEEDRLDLPIGSLSGGQKRRLEIARILFAGSDLLLLDEPTNHVSLALAGELEEALGTAPGGVVLASHDRWLRRRWEGPELTLPGWLLAGDTTPIEGPPAGGVRPAVSVGRGAGSVGCGRGWAGGAWHGPGGGRAGGEGCTRPPRPALPSGGGGGGWWGVVLFDAGAGFYGPSRGSI